MSCSWSATAWPWRIRFWHEGIVWNTKEEPLARLEMEPTEYERRREFCEGLKEMSRSEHIEIARVLRKHNVPTSENRSGIFFDMVKLPQEVFDALLVFREFVQQNNRELEKRDCQ